MNHDRINGIEYRVGIESLVLNSPSGNQKSVRVGMKYELLIKSGSVIDPKNAIDGPWSCLGVF